MQLFEHGYRLHRQRDAVFLSAFHPFGGNRPFCRFKIKLNPAGLSRFARPGACRHQQLDAARRFSLQSPSVKAMQKTIHFCPGQSLAVLATMLGENIGLECLGGIVANVSVIRLRQVEYLFADSQGISQQIQLAAGLDWLQGGFQNG